jgi:methionyl aminopeptidase
MTRRKKRKRKVMRVALPIRKHQEEIKFYKEHAPMFGDLLYGLYRDIKHGCISTGKDIIDEFEARATSLFWGEFLRFPFEIQKDAEGNEFNYSCCVSINDVVAHGIPNDQRFKINDIISVDCGIELTGPFGNLNFDSGFTVQYNSMEQPEWILSTHEALKNIINNQPKDTYSIAKTVEGVAAEYNMLVVARLAGHGIGRGLHEAPTIRNLMGSYANSAFFEGLCFCVEPIFVLPKQIKECFDNKIANVYIDSDGWSIRTIDGQPASHFETMYCIENGKVVDLCKITEWFSKGR